MTISASLPILKLKQQRSKPFWQGESLVFSGALDTKQKEPTDIQLVLVAEHTGAVLGCGFYNPHSSYRVRLIEHGKAPLSDLSEILKKRFQAAIDFRKSIGLPSDQESNQTNAYRLVNSEGDSLSGLTIDVFGNHLVLAVTAAWVMKSQEIIESILKELFPDFSIHWRPNVSALKQDGWVFESSAIPENNSNLVSILENGLAYQVDITRGQKTGFYCDQRENRSTLRKFAQSRRVLDTCCYTGGFAMNAAKAGATSVLAIDSSESALNIARENAKLNQLENIEFQKQDVEKFLSESTELFDLIILDPPKLVPSKEKIHAGKKLYLRLNRLALQHLSPNGMLVTCSCSDAMTKELFEETLVLAATQADRKISIKLNTGAAPDHTLQKGARFGDYLKVFWVSAE